MKSIFSIAVLVTGSSYPLMAASKHPCVLLDSSEIAAIQAKVKAGQEPWKGAAAKAISIANDNLGKTYYIPSCYDHYWGNKGEGCSYDAHRRTGEAFGEALQNAAMAWHLTGERKYVDWTVKNINAWFFDPATYMKPAVPGGTTVGIDASFSGVVAGLDMMWPALDTGLLTKVMTWFKALNTAHHNHRDAGSHNRGDWWASAAAIIGQFVGDATARDVGIEQIRKRLGGLKRADANFTAKINQTINGNYDYFILPDEGKREETVLYNYFDLCAIVGCIETARHAGVDLYNYRVPGDPISRFEGLMNYYGALKLDPTLYPDFANHGPARGDRFLNWDFKKAFSIFEVAYSYKANKVYMDVINQQGRPITYDWIDPGVFLSATLTHARGAYPLSIGAGVPIPSVNIDSPAHGSLFAPGDTVIIRATASHEGGTIAKVAFYDGESLLGEDTNAPYEWRLEGITEGQHTLKAVAVDDKGETATASVNVKALAPASLPGRLEAEEYSAMKGIQTEATSDAGGGTNVGWIETGDWLEYRVSVAAAGTYVFAYRGASTGGSGQLELMVDGAAVHRVAMPATGGWQSWTTVTAEAELHAGAHTLRIAATGPDWNINYVEVGGPGATVAVTSPSAAVSNGLRLTRRSGATVRFAGAAPGETVRLWSLDGRLVTQTRADRGGAGILGTPASGALVLKSESGEPVMVKCQNRKQ